MNKAKIVPIQKHFQTDYKFPKRPSGRSEYHWSQR